VATVEVTTFRLAAGVEPETFLSADARAQTEFFYARAGLLRRTTAVADDGDWVAVALWRSAADADAAGVAAVQNRAARDWAELVEVSGVRRYRTFD